MNLDRIDIYKIMEYLPHRHPFFMIDYVENVVMGKSIIGVKNVSANEPFFAGHFPGNPVMPGVLILESMAQSAGVLIFVTKQLKPHEKLYYFAGVDNARFKQIVSPGDQLRLHMTVERERQDVWKFHGKAMVGDKVACEANIMLAGER